MGLTTTDPDPYVIGTTNLTFTAIQGGTDLEIQQDDTQVTETCEVLNIEGDLVSVTDEGSNKTTVQVNSPSVARILGVWEELNRGEHTSSGDTQKIEFFSSASDSASDFDMIWVQIRGIHRVGATVGDLYYNFYEEGGSVIAASYYMTREDKFTDANNSPQRNSNTFGVLVSSNWNTDGDATEDGILDIFIPMPGDTTRIRRSKFEYAKEMFDQQGEGIIGWGFLNNNAAIDAVAINGTKTQTVNWTPIPTLFEE